MPEPNHIGKYEILEETGRHVIGHDPTHTEWERCLPGQ